MNTRTLIISTVVLLLTWPATGHAAGANVTRDALACESIGHFALMDNYEADEDEVALKKYRAGLLKRGKCRIIKAGTPVIFYSLVTYTDGDYGSYTTVRRKGDPRPWVIDKCSLDGRDPEVARFPGAVPPEKPCTEE